MTNECAPYHRPFEQIRRLLQHTSPYSCNEDYAFLCNVDYIHDTLHAASIELCGRSKYFWPCLEMIRHYEMMIWPFQNSEATNNTNVSRFKWYQYCCFRYLNVMLRWCLPPSWDRHAWWYWSLLFDFQLSPIDLYGDEPKMALHLSKIICMINIALGMSQRCWPRCSR